jgi:hypothetical protein
MAAVPAIRLRAEHQSGIAHVSALNGMESAPQTRQSDPTCAMKAIRVR